MTFYNPREKPVRVGEMETHLAPSVYCDQAMTEPPALSQCPTMHLCSFSYHQGFLFIHSTWHYQQPLHHSLAMRSEIKSNCSAAGSELSCPSPQHNVQIVHFDQMQNKIFLPRSNNCSCYYRTMFIKEHLNCSIDKTELSAQLHNELSISLSL